MLFTITYEGRDTQNLGFLLHKNPERPQQFDLAFGKAYVFYPELSDERTTAALLIDIDPLDLARGKAGSQQGGLFDYVNDRPYASTSFMCSAISRVFGTAMSGRCQKFPELAETPLKLTARIFSLRDNGNEAAGKGGAVSDEWQAEPPNHARIDGPLCAAEGSPGQNAGEPASAVAGDSHCPAGGLPGQNAGEPASAVEGDLLCSAGSFPGQNAGKPNSALKEELQTELKKITVNRELARELFEPLGYEVSIRRSMLDDAFPEWGMSPYIDLTISGTVRLSDLLRHIYVLIPVFDRQKHYYMAENEIQKFLSHGEGWLAGHPCRGKIAYRYFSGSRPYARKALDILLSGEEEPASPTDVSDCEETKGAVEGTEERPGLNARRLEAVKEAVLASGAASVIDLGCGECKLVSLLLNESRIRKVGACDVSLAALEKGAKRLHLDRMQPYRKNKLQIFHSSLTYRDSRFEGYDCACLVEVIEHIDPMRLPALERSVFEFASPGTVIVTTPNREYNELYMHIGEDALRHRDHRFEWTRAEFEEWAEHISERFAYSYMISGIGDEDERLGSPTQMGVFTKNG